MAFKTGGRKCKFESLETRQMMAGDVVGRVSDGTLVLKGDGFDNGITITAGAVPNSVEVKGVTPLLGTPTNVNGLPNTTVTFLNVIHGLTIKMGRGNDQVTIDDLNVNGLTRINTGFGVDTVLINDSTLCKGLTIDSGPDADDITIIDTNVQGKTKITTGGDCDHVTINALTGTSTFGTLEVNLGDDNDEISITNTQVTVLTSLDGGLGINTFVNGGNNFFSGFYYKKNLNGA